MVNDLVAFFVKVRFNDLEEIVTNFTEFLTDLFLNKLIRFSTTANGGRLSRPNANLFVFNPGSCSPT